MAKPTKHAGKWRIRWLDEHGKGQSAVFDDYKRAQTETAMQPRDVARDHAPLATTFKVPWVIGGTSSTGCFPAAQLRHGATMAGPLARRPEKGSKAASIANRRVSPVTRCGRESFPTRERIKE
ncbi:MAG: hypothetical protein WBY94_09770 [Polyangiaceae bacterium]